MMVMSGLNALKAMVTYWGRVIQFRCISKHFFIIIFTSLAWYFVKERFMSFLFSINEYH